MEIDGTLDGVAASALDCAGDAIIVIDRDGVVRAWNRMCTRLFGWTAEEAIGRDVSFMIPEKLREAHDRGFRAAMERGALASDGRARRTRSETKTGERCYVEMTFSVLQDPSGAAIGSVAVARPAPSVHS